MPVGSGDWLGIKVIKLNKIKENANHRLKILLAALNLAKPSFQSSILQATNSNLKLSNRNLAASPSASEPPKSPLKSIAKKSALA